MDIRPVLTRSLYDDLHLQVGKDAMTAIAAGHRFWPGMSPSESAAASIWTSFYKKWEGARTEQSDSSAVDLFASMNLRCKEWTWKLNTSMDELLVGELKASLDGFFRPRNVGILVDSPVEVSLFGRLGPGVNLGARNESFYAKLFSSPLTTTDPSLYNWYRRYIDRFPTWSAAEVSRCAAYGTACIVSGSRISLVPKNDKISRLICAEPTLNMFFQLGLAEILERRLYRYFGIDLSTQPETNRRLAYEGSVDDDLVTLDLSSASDTLSLKLAKEIFPCEFFTEINRYRSSRAQLPSGELLDLHMVSTMGNGFTFPLQTIVFSAVVDAAFRSFGSSGRTRRDWSVFGDDIICPRFVAHRVVRLLELIGCIVNIDKSFSEGPFRESCGFDFHSGVNVRGVYIKSLRTPQDRYSVINQLNLFSERTGLLLPETVGTMLKTVWWQPVPFVEADDAGIRVPYSALRKGDIKWSKRYQSHSYVRSVAEPIQYHFVGERVVVPRGYKSLIYNPNGHMISILHGSVNSDAVSVRHDRVRYRRRRGVLNHWNRAPTAPPIPGWERFWRRFETVTLYNLNRM